MTEVIWLAYPIRDYQIEEFDPKDRRGISLHVVGNYLPSSRLPKKGDYLVVHTTVNYIDLPDGSQKRVQDSHYLLMTYSFFRKNYDWTPRPGQTRQKTRLCKPKY